MTNSDLTQRNGGRVQRSADVFGALRTEMERMFDRFEHSRPHWPGAFARSLARGMMVPEVDLHDNGKQLMIEVDLPGFDEKDVAVTLVNGLLTIKGERKTEREEKEDNYYLTERRHGAFERSLQLPDTVDEAKLEAKFDKGVLKVIAQKKPEAIKAERKIEIKKG